MSKSIARSTAKEISAYPGPSIELRIVLLALQEVNPSCSGYDPILPVKIVGVKPQQRNRG